MRWTLTRREFVSGCYRCVPADTGWNVLHHAGPVVTVLHSNVTTIKQAKDLAQTHLDSLQEPKEPQCTSP